MYCPAGVLYCIHCIEALVVTEPSWANHLHSFRLCTIAAMLLLLLLLLLLLHCDSGQPLAFLALADQA